MSLIKPLQVCIACCSRLGQFFTIQKALSFYSQLLVSFFLIIGSTLSFSNTLATIEIDDSSIKLEEFEVGYFIDDTHEASFEHITQQVFTTSENGLSLGTKALTAWIKVDLENITAQPKDIYLHNDFAYRNKKLTLYEVVDNDLINSRELDLDNKQTHEWIFKGVAIFDVHLLPNERKTLYIKSETYAYQWLSIKLYDNNSSKRALPGSYIEFALAAGILLILAISNLILYTFSRRIEYFFYSCYLLSGGIWISLSYGLLANTFNVYGRDMLLWHFSLGAMPIFLNLFSIKVFETKKDHRVEHYALLMSIGMLSANILYGLLGNREIALQNTSTLAAIWMMISISVSISIALKKHALGLLFLFGHGMFAVFCITSILFYKGLIDFSYVARHGVGIGIMLEAMILSLIVANHVRGLEKIKLAQKELSILASTDPLTQLFNRRRFNSEVSYLTKESPSLTISIALMDIDLFKKINDQHGHGVGDKALITIAEMLQSQCREQDVIARYGGEEFIVCMPNTDLSKAHELAESLRQVVENLSIEIADGSNIALTMSIGISQIDSTEMALDQAINQADKALYQAKKNGRNNVVAFSH